MLSIALKKCIDEKLSDNDQFKLDDFGSDVIDDVLERLKGKRVMNNKEIKYLNGLFQRAIALPKPSLVHPLCKTQYNLLSHVTIFPIFLVLIQNQDLNQPPTG